MSGHEINGKHIPLTKDEYIKASGVFGDNLVEDPKKAEYVAHAEDESRTRAALVRKAGAELLDAYLGGENTYLFAVNGVKRANNRRQSEHDSPTRAGQHQLARAEFLKKAQDDHAEFDHDLDAYLPAKDNTESEIDAIFDHIGDTLGRLEQDADRIGDAAGEKYDKGQIIKRKLGLKP